MSDNKQSDWIYEPGDLELLRIAKDIEREEYRPALENPRKVEWVNMTKNALGELIEGDEIKIKAKVHDPYPSIGYISVEGKMIVITNPRGFLDAISMSSTLDVCPKVKGKVELELTFNGLTTRTGGKR